MGGGVWLESDDDDGRIRLVHSFLEYIFNFITESKQKVSLVVLHEESFRGATNEVIIFLQLLVRRLPPSLL